MKIESDRIILFLVCMAVAMAFSIIGAFAIHRLAPDAPQTRALLGAIMGFVVATLAGMEKERWESRLVVSKFSWGDFLTDTLGAAVGSLGGLVSYLA